MVGGLVEQKYIRLLKQQAAKRHTATLTPRECADLLVIGRTTQRIHGALELIVDIPGIGGIELILQLGLAVDELVHLLRVLKHLRISKGIVDLIILLQELHDGGHALLYNLAHRLVGVKFGILLKVAHRIARREHHLALIALVETGDNLEQCRLTAAIQADDADFRTIEE